MRLNPTEEQILRVLEYIDICACPDTIWPGAANKSSCCASHELGAIQDWRTACLECWLDAAKEKVKEGE